MFERIIAFSVNNKFIIALFTLAIVGAGLYSIDHIPIDAVPDITNNQVQVVTSSPSLTAEEVERFITYPVEVSMANLPGVVELRSISRYGLSVVTIVFEDGIPVTDTRQYVSEQISVAAEEIPEGLGHPELMPVTTGLGEIYQYALEVDDAHKSRYDPMALRTIQDWIVKRQLSGIDGVVEVSSFGGFLKQIQVSVEPARLRSLDLTIDDVLTALRANNQNTGGSYLQRGPNAVYIRAEGVVKDVQEIENIVIRREGSPVLLKQVARVDEGFAPRYGAMTKNGQGEAVGGITLMLKDANSSKTLENIHKRVEEIQSSLPEGVRIVPYLDRSELVARTTGTIKKNLIEGGLIVIFVLVLLLGNLRAGLIVASVIPLSLMFAFIMMNLFGVSANLMSLGALDFGIVIDGAVIIVEGVLHVLAVSHAGQMLTRKELDGVVVKSASAIYRSAAFGVLIIIVVFIPIMTLTGIEGKMFRPMAQTVSFAVLGALVLSVTYVPMLSALLLNRNVRSHKTFSDRIVQSIQRGYEPILRKALAHPRYTVGIAVALLLSSVVVFTRLGGVFIPQLEEGDIAMQISLPTGSSLDETIRTTTQAEQILMKNFPEVRHVISKIGTAEVPTDPMSVELADVMIVMKEKEEWTSARTREELVARMEEALSTIIGASFDFSQPIQLRFNELMTGAKTDVAVKIFGEDMELLHKKAVEAAGIAREVEGAADLVVEQTEGLPQLLVQYDRQRLAQYGIPVEDLNTVIRAAFAGEPAGVVFEGERKFDLVVRLPEEHRKKFDLGGLYVRDGQHRLIPVSAVATATESLGPAQVSRDDTRRRVTLGVNVRGRDVESVVQDLQARLEARLDLPPGYFITYGGDFENLQQAKKRLSVAVPVALLMIVVLLYFAFGSFKYAFLIFAAVPLSAIGGVFALWFRDLPFSISAGVGFIALFGVAVLNGIVLISYFNELREDGELPLDQVVMKGGMVRLRPVIMTAAVAALGFLPMALSETAGAEVQRPLATVVIGGLVSATLLTLVVLPVLYRAIEARRERRAKARMSPALVITFFVLASLPTTAQQAEPRVLSESEAIAIALERNPTAKISALDVQQQKTRQRAAVELPSTSVDFQYGQLNSDARDPSVGIRQGLGSIPAHFQRGRVARYQVAAAEEQHILNQKELVFNVRNAWQDWLYSRQALRELDAQLSFYGNFEEKADLQYRLGERSMLEKRMIESTLHELQNEYVSQSEDLRQARNNLSYLLVIDEDFIPLDDSLTSLISLPDTVTSEHPSIRIHQRQLEESRAQTKLDRAELFPEFSVGYFRQDITETDVRFRGLQGAAFEVAIPLWAPHRRANVQRSKIGELQAEERLALAKIELARARQNAVSDVRKYQRILDYYRSEGLEQAAGIRRTATIQMEAGEIDFFQYLQSMQRYTQMRLRYFSTIREYNRSVIRLEFLSE